MDGVIGNFVKGFSAAAPRSLPAFANTDGKFSLTTRGKTADKSLVARSTSYTEIIALNDVQENLQHVWPKIKDKMQLVAGVIIRRNLGVHDSYSMTPSGAFILELGGTRVQAMERAVKIRNEIRDVAASLLREAGNRGHWAARSDEMKREKNRPLVLRGKNGNPLLFRAATPPALTGAHRPRPLLRIDENGKGLLPEPLEFCVQPVWDTVSKRHAALYIQPLHQDRNGVVYSGYDVVPEFAKEALYLELDLMQQEAVAAYLARIPAQMKALCPVHYKTLADARMCRAYVDAWKKLPAETLKRLSFEIMHMPGAIDSHDITHAVRALQQITPNIIVRAGFDGRNERDIAQAGAIAVSVDIQQLKGLPESLVKNRMQHFLRKATRNHLRTLAHGLENESLIGMMKDIGVSCLCGSGTRRIHDSL